MYKVRVNWKIKQKSPDFHLHGTLHFFFRTRLSNNVNANPTNKKKMYPLYVYLEDVLHMLLFILHLVLCCVLELLIPVKCRRSRMHQIELLKLISISFQVPFKGIYSSNEVKCSQSAVPFYYNFVFKRVRIQCDIRRVKLEVVVHFSMCYI